MKGHLICALIAAMLFSVAADQTLFYTDFKPSAKDGALLITQPKLWVRYAVVNHSFL